MPPLLPPTLVDGFHREDYRPDDPQWLSAARAPAVGQHVKLQLGFAHALPTRSAGEPSTWCLMRGVIEEVLPDDRVRVRMSATSDLTPIGFDRGEFEATLVRDDRYGHPWQLERIFRVEPPTDPTSLPPLDFAQRIAAIRVLVTGPRADGFLAAVAAGLDTLASAGLPDVPSPPRGVVLAHAVALVLGEIRGWRTRLLLFTPTPTLWSTWSAAADAVIEVDGGAYGSVPEVPTERVALEACAPIERLRTIVTQVLVARRGAG